MKFYNRKLITINGKTSGIPSEVYEDYGRLKNLSLATDAEQNRLGGQALGNFRRAISEELHLGPISNVYPFLMYLGVLQGYKGLVFDTFGEQVFRKEATGEILESGKKAFAWVPRERKVFFAIGDWCYDEETNPEGLLFNKNNINTTKAEDDEEDAVSPKYNTVRIMPGRQEDFLEELKNSTRYQGFQSEDVDGYRERVEAMYLTWDEEN